MRSFAHAEDMICRGSAAGDWMIPGGRGRHESALGRVHSIVRYTLDRRVSHNRMHTMKGQLGNLERQLFAYAQMRGLGVLGTGDLVGPLRISPRQERDLLSRLSRAGMLAKVQRGLYLVPPRLPLGGKWSPDEVTAINALMDAREGRYQICGPNAFNRYGFDDQVPARVYAYNNRTYGERAIGAVQLTLIKVADERLGATEEAKLPGGQKAVYSSRARTLVDAVYDWSRFEGLPRAYRWIREELAAKRVRATELVDLVLRYGNRGTARRIGVLLEGLGTRRALLRKLESVARKNGSTIPWIPTLAKRGHVDRRWGVVVNGEA
jgi:predicted transcriptional regulator of viral defense system